MFLLYPFNIDCIDCKKGSDCFLSEWSWELEPREFCVCCCYLWVSALGPFTCLAFSCQLSILGVFTHLSSNLINSPQVQCLLQDVGSSIATPRSLASPNQLELTEFSEVCVVKLEKWINEYTRLLPPLKNFILPSGGKTGASLHVARAVCRRAERRLTPLVQKEEVDENVGKFMNRLSDYLFTLARYASHCEDIDPTIYIKVRSRKRKKWAQHGVYPLGK